MSPRVAPLLGLALLVWPPAPAAAEPSPRCRRALLVQAGTEAARALRCEASLARRGGDRGAGCGLDAFRRLPPGEARCGAGVFAGGGRTLVTNLVGFVRPLLRAGDEADACAAARLLAAAGRARAGLRCAVRPAGVPVCLGRARRRLEAALGGDPCPDAGPAAALDARVDAFAVAVGALLELDVTRGPVYTP